MVRLAVGDPARVLHPNGKERYRGVVVEVYPGTYGPLYRVGDEEGQYGQVRLSGRLVRPLEDR